MARTGHQWSEAEVRDLPLTVDLRKAAEIIGISYSHAHDLATREEFPLEVLKIGTRHKVRSSDLRRYLKIDQAL